MLPKEIDFDPGVKRVEYMDPSRIGMQGCFSRELPFRPDSRGEIREEVGYRYPISIVEQKIYSPTSSLFVHTKRKEASLLEQTYIAWQKFEEGVHPYGMEIELKEVIMSDTLASVGSVMVDKVNPSREIIDKNGTVFELIPIARIGSFSGDSLDGEITAVLVENNRYPFLQILGGGSIDIKSISPVGRQNGEPIFNVSAVDDSGETAEVSLKGHMFKFGNRFLSMEMIAERGRPYLVLNLLVGHHEQGHFNVLEERYGADAMRRLQIKMPVSLDESPWDEIEAVLLHQRYPASQLEELLNTMYSTFSYT